MLSFSFLLDPVILSVVKSNKNFEIKFYYTAEETSLKLSKAFISWAEDKVLQSRFLIFVPILTLGICD